MPAGPVPDNGPEGAEHIMPKANTWRDSKPLVTYIISTYNRRHYLPIALRSALDQTYRNLQIIVVRDGGDEVRDIIESFGDERLLLLDRAQNRGLAYSYNEAVPYVKGKYIAYLGDDDIHYPHHIETNVAALEASDEYQASYSRLYRTLVYPMPGGRRKVLSKTLMVDRDFDLLQQLHFNLVLGGAAVHRTDLLEKTGPYNESVRVLIDWDMMRRISFFTPFLSIPAVTGEFFANYQSESDRISDKQRQDKIKYFQNTLAIRNSRPPKPWKTCKDLSIIWTPSQVNEQSITQLGQILQLTFTPFQIYIPMTPAELRCLNVQAPAIHGVGVPDDLTPTQRLDAALEQADGDYVCWLPDRATIKALWAEEALYPLENHPEWDGMLLRSDSPETQGFVLPTETLRSIRARYPDLPIRKSIEQAGLQLGQPGEDDPVFPVNSVLSKAKTALHEERFADAADLFAEARKRQGEPALWLRVCQIYALYHEGTRDDEAIALCRDTVHHRPWIDLLMVYGKLLRRNDQPNQAIEVLEQAHEMMEYTVTA